MLIDIDSGRPITRIPYSQQFETLRKRLSPAEITSIVDRINQLIDAGGGDLATAGRLPGSDWTGSPFEPIYYESRPR